MSNSNLLTGIALPDLSAKKPRKPFRKQTAKEVAERQAPSGEKAAAQTVKGRNIERAAPAKRFDLSGFHPHRRVTYIGQQVCRDCGKRTSYIAGDLLEYYERETVARKRTIRTRAFALGDYRWTNLPHEHEYLSEDVVTCPECLSTNDVLDAFFEHKHELQLPLFV